MVNRERWCYFYAVIKCVTLTSVLFYVEQWEERTRDMQAELYEVYINVDESHRPAIGWIESRMGSKGIEILSSVLSDCDDAC